MANYSEWQLQALEDFKYSGLSYDEIGKKHGRSRDTIIKLVNRSQIQRVKALQRHSLQRLEDKQQLSPIHRSIGVKLNLYRTVHNSQTMTECAERIGSNRYRIKAMENGVHDFTLTELQKVAALLDMTVVDLLTPTTPNVYQQPQKPKELNA